MGQNSFRIIALRVLQGCDAKIRRALHEEETYFLYNDYEDEFNEDGLWKGIRNTENTKEKIASDFFKIPTKGNKIKKTPIISVSAIVGKNGDGKSSLVELILRIINNFGVENGFKIDQESLAHVNGIEAILYYEIGGKLYYIKCTHETVDTSFAHEYVDKDKLKQHEEELFYTIVANYSIYAYNSRHLQQEVEEEDECWINGVFHKNDSYQTPLVLNPMRTQGNFDINKEEDLCHQRLMTIYSDLGDDEVARRINGNKIATGFAFNLEEKSKLETVTLKKYFQKTWKSTSLYNEAAHFERYLGSQNQPLIELVESEFNDQVWFWAHYLEKWDKYDSLFKLAEKVNWEVYKDNNAEEDDGVTDLKRYLKSAKNGIERYVSKRDEQQKAIKSINIVNAKCRKLTGLQFQRLVLIIDVCELWAEHSWFAKERFYTAIRQYTNNQAGRSIEKRQALLYVIYKTINIFSQYKRFLDLLEVDVRYFYLFDRKKKDGVEYYKRLPECFDLLFTDSKKEHIEKKYDTLKLRQTINFMKYGSFKTNNTQDPYTGKDFMYERYVTFNRLNGFIRDAKKKCNEETIALLPPPIFIGDILVREGEDKPGNKRYRMADLSSGELQMLNSISTYIYHLRNLNYHVGAEHAIEYSYVNLILEEVELYFHPEYQRQYVYRMIKQIEQAKLENIEGINIILVTHSPFVLSDIPKSNVLFLKGGLPVYVMQENTFGANIHALLQNGFFLEGAPMGEFAKEKINKMFERLHDNEYGEDLFEEIKLVSEPLLKTQLYQLYSLNKLPHQASKYEELEARIKELEDRLNG